MKYHDNFPVSLMKSEWTINRQSGVLSGTKEHVAVAGTLECSASQLTTSWLAGWKQERQIGKSTWNLDMMSKCFFMSVPSTILIHVVRRTGISSDLSIGICIITTNAFYCDHQGRV